MQALGTQQFPFNRLVVLAATAMALTTALLVANVLYDATRDDAHAPVSLSPAFEQTASSRDSIMFLEQNTQLPAAKISAARSADAIAFSEQNVWEVQGADNVMTAAGMRFAEDNGFDYAVSYTADEVKFLEENIWDYEPHARLAGNENSHGPTDFRFIEENIWDIESPMIPPADTGAADY